MNKTEAFNYTQRLLKEIYNGNEKEAKKIYRWVGQELDIKDEVKK